VEEIKIEETDVAKMVEAASEARGLAYAPYTGFQMGAAVMTESGQIVQGSLVENVSLGLAMCSERVALFSSVLSGSKPIALALVSPPTDGTLTRPCGACLQVALELGGPQLVVIAASVDGESSRHLLGDMLPFGPVKD